MTRSQPISPSIRRLPPETAIALAEQELERRRSERLRRDVAQHADEIRDRCQTLHGFIREAWHILEPKTPFVDGWVIKAICDHLEAVTRGEIQYLLINVPPGMMKSLLVSVFWPAWEWGPKGSPHLRYLSTSYSEPNVVRDNTKMRRLIESGWYQALWGDKVTFAKDQNAKLKFENTATGYREGRPFGSMTGGRGDRVLIDDPHSTETAESDAERENATRIFRESLSDRLNDLQTSAVVIIMQRLNALDVSGVILKLGLDYVHLCLPMEFEAARRCSTRIGFTDPRTQEDELLFPERFPREKVEALKLVKGSYAYAGQYQQRPTPREGGMFKRSWFGIVNAAPIGTRWVRGWDLAATESPGAAYTTGVKIGKGPDNVLYVGHVIRERLEGTGVRKLMVSTAELDGASCEIVFPKDPGQAGKVQAADIVAMLMGYRVFAEPQTGSKETRAEPIAAQAEAGNLKLVRAPWNDALIDEAATFPNGAFKDQVDALASAFSRLSVRKGIAMGSL